MPDALEKVVSAVLRTLTTALVGGTGYQLFDGRWFGETIFNAYLQQQTVVLLTPPATDELYSAFAAQSLPQAMQNTNAALVFVSVVLLLLLFAHVVSKPTVAKLRATLQAVRRPRSVPRTRADWKRTMSFVRSTYVRFHELGTVCLFLALTSLFLFWPFNRGLAIAFLLLTIPAALYLFVYPADISRGEFSERFVYVCVFALLVVAVLGWPRLYGQRHFDPAFAVASSGGGGLDHCDENLLLKGPTFVAFEKADEQVLFRLCFDKTGQNKYLDFFSSKGQPLTKVGYGNLRLVIKAFVPPEPQP